MITLEQAKDHCRIDKGYTVDDERIESLIATATAQVEQLTGLTEGEMSEKEKTIAQQAVALFVDYHYNGEERCDKAANALCLQIRKYNK